MIDCPVGVAVVSLAAAAAAIVEVPEKRVLISARQWVKEHGLGRRRASDKDGDIPQGQVHSLAGLRHEKCH